jgi:hypothetical protein
LISGAPSSRSRRLPLTTRPPAYYGAIPRQEPGDCKSRDSKENLSVKILDVYFAFYDIDMHLFYSYRFYINNIKVGDISYRFAQKRKKFKDCAYPLAS